MTLPDIVAVLSNEPFNRSIEEIRRLTLFQVFHVLLRRRNKDGTVRLSPHRYQETDSLTESQQTLNYCKLHHVPLWWVKENHGQVTRPT